MENSKSTMSTNTAIRIYNVVPVRAYTFRNGTLNE